MAGFGGHNCVGHNCTGHNCICHNYTVHDYAGHNYIGHNYVGHNYLGHNHIDRNYMGHAYIGDRVRPARGGVSASRGAMLRRHSMPTSASPAAYIYRRRRRPAYIGIADGIVQRMREGGASAEGFPMVRGILVMAH